MRSVHARWLVVVVLYSVHPGGWDPFRVLELMSSQFLAAGAAITAITAAGAGAVADD
jgi:hypothetical protein